MKHVMVTVGTGDIGSHACNLLSQRGYVPVTFDSLVTGWTRPSPSTSQSL